MGWTVPQSLEAEIDALVARYPVKRSASLMVLHALQRHFGWLSQQAIEWTAQKLGLQPIHIYELVTFYPMFRQEPVGRWQIKVCRTLSCWLAGSHELHRRLCERLGLDPHRQGPQTTADGRFTVEFVECLACCHTAPVVMINDDLWERVSLEQVESWLTRPEQLAASAPAQAS
ncbi:MAG: NAD(P)H-dependent oxidoreductase subunit E [Verrucomicrobiota bacterium]|nr:NAD(P)H-dependent oxidoreductase subunit E [Limisphaera sp.]MDW8382493.1 NAD(P)H-dependent oxidoreductase subunit E [Verrucomicrobiota bacterium]